MFTSQFTKSKTVLDAGCGMGCGSSLLLSRGAKKVVGIDIEENVITYL